MKTNKLFKRFVYDTTNIQFLPLTTPSSSPVANVFSLIKESAVTKLLLKKVFY